MIHDLISALDKAVGQASDLLLGRKGTKGGRPRDPEFKFYTALVLYRMGHSPDDIARRIGISAPNPPEWVETGAADEKFNDNWKNQLSKAIKKGIEIEQEKFPVAADVFTHMDEKGIQEEALAAYEEYNNRVAWWPLNVTATLEDGDDLLGMPANETEQTRDALIQLGFCIKRGLDPLSPNLD